MHLFCVCWCNAVVEACSQAFAQWPTYPMGVGGAFLKKLGASFSRDPLPPGVGVGHWWVFFVPCLYIFQAAKAPENFFLCSFPYVVWVVWWVGAS